MVVDENASDNKKIDKKNIIKKTKLEILEETSIDNEFSFDVPRKIYLKKNFKINISKKFDKKYTIGIYDNNGENNDNYYIIEGIITELDWSCGKIPKKPGNYNIKFIFDGDATPFYEKKISILYDIPDIFQYDNLSIEDIKKYLKFYDFDVNVTDEIIKIQFMKLINLNSEYNWFINAC